MPRVRRSNPLNLPPRVYARHGALYFYAPDGRTIRLGKEWDLAARVKWAELAGENAPAGSVRELLQLYRVQVVPTKAPRTQTGNLLELERLDAAFGHMEVNALRLKHARDYLKARAAKVRGNREIALLSHAIRWAMNEGLCTFASHPFDGIMFNKERPRDRYVRDGELERFIAFARAACPIIAAVESLMYLTGQRRVDLLSMRRSAILADGLEVIQSKTGARLLIEWTPRLRAAVDDALAVHERELARRNVASIYLLCTRDGDRYTDSGIKAMRARTMRSAMATEFGPPVIVDRFRQQDLRPKAVSDVGGGKRGKDLAGHRTQSTTDRIYDRVTFKRVKPTR